jgi:hypothetical protein
MVDISGKLEQISALVSEGKYFVINRARQYGKTTILAALERKLADDYVVSFISFEGLGEESFKTSQKFCRSFINLIWQSLEFSDLPDEYKNGWLDNDVTNFDELGNRIKKMCKDKKVLLLIDEVDKTSNNKIFLQFLSMLRAKYLASKNGKDYTFHSVILAGVYDIRNIKLKIINEGGYSPLETEGKIYNSPWNIAVKFDVDMSFSPAEISSMLADYEADHSFGFDVSAIAEKIYEYTSGYPFLVSRICQCIDEELDKNWTESGVTEAVKIIVNEDNVLFDDLSKNLENYPELFDFLYSVLIVGEEMSYNIGNPVVRLADMFGYIKRGESRGKAAISNRIFEIYMSDYFISKDETKPLLMRKNAGVLHQDIVKGGVFDMELCLRKFA